MNITHEFIDELIAVIKIEVIPDDYLQKVSNVLKEQQKKRIDGFRPGKVPISVLKKKFEKAIKHDEIKKIVVEMLFKYIEQNKLDYFGAPIEKRENIENINWEAQSEFEFFYELGILPHFEIEPLDSFEVKYYDITVDDETVNYNIEEMRKNYGNYTKPEIIGANDIVEVELTEIDISTSPLKGGIHKKVFFAPDLIPNETLKNRFFGAALESTVNIERIDEFQEPIEIARMLEINVASVAGLVNKFSAKITYIRHYEPADLNKEFFEKMFGQGVETEEAFREKTREQIRETYDSYSDKKLFANIEDLLLERTPMNLPDAFMKKLLLSGYFKRKFTHEEIEMGYDYYARNLKWEMISTRLVRDHGIEVLEEEIKYNVKIRLLSKMNSMPTMEALEEHAKDYMINKKDETKSIHEKIEMSKLFKLLKNSIKLEHIEISYPEFVTLVNLHDQDHEHHHDQDHDHEY